MEREDFMFLPLITALASIGVLFGGLVVLQEVMRLAALTWLMLLTLIQYPASRHHCIFFFS